MSDPPAIPAPGGRKDTPIALALFTGFLLLYLRTLCPTVYLGDSGDFCTAIATGGVAHPPGYPLFLLLGRTALALVPYGEPAFRIGCLVALAAAAAVTALYALCREVGCSRWAAAVATSTFGVSYTFWSQATRVEVYSLHVLLCGALLLAALRYRRTGRPNWLAAAGLTGSLGLAHHLTIVLLVPPIVILCGARLWNDPARWRRLAMLAALMPLGPVLYLVLLIWARAEPLHAWGNPITLPLLWNHASAQAYRVLCLETPTSATLPERLMLAARLYGDSFPYLLWLLPILGGVVLWGRDRRVVISLLLAVITVILYNQCYAIDDIAPFYLTAWLSASILLSVALEAIRSMVSGPRRSVALLGAVSCVLMGVLLIRNWSACDLSRSTWVRDYAQHALEGTESGGVLLTRVVDDTFPVWYVQDVLKLRPDVITIDRASLRFTGIFYEWEPSLWYLHQLRRHGVRISIPARPAPDTLASMADDRFLIGLLERELRGRAVYSMFSLPWAPGDVKLPRLYRWAWANYRPVPEGLLLRLHRKDQPLNLHRLLERNERLWAAIRLPELQGRRTDQEMAPEYVIDRYAAMLVSFGNLQELMGHSDRAALIYQQAVEWAPHYQPARKALALLRQRPQLRPKMASASRREEGG